MSDEAGPPTGATTVEPNKPDPSSGAGDDGRKKLGEIQRSRRDFITGALAVGTLSAIGTYVAPGGRAPTSATINFASGDDPTGAMAVLFGMWGEANPNLTVRTIPVGGESTAAQRDALADKARSGEADVLNIDVINLPYFQQQGLIVPIELNDVQQFLPSSLLASKLGNPNSSEYWAGPFSSNVGMMYQRLGQATDAVGLVPSLQAVVDGAAPDHSGQFCGQLLSGPSSSREAFVVNMLEHALSRDPSLLDPRTGMPSTAVEKWQAALVPLREALRRGRATPADNETDTRKTYHEKNLTFMRNWPVEYRNLQVDGDADSLARRVRVGALPVGIRGGSGLAVSAKSRQAGHAADLIRFLTSVPAQFVQASYYGVATRGDVYVDQKLQTSMPHLKIIEDALERARPRPISPYYTDFSDTVATYFDDFINRGVDLTTGGFVDDIQKALHLK